MPLSHCIPRQHEHHSLTLYADFKDTVEYDKTLRASAVWLRGECAASLARTSEHTRNGEITSPQSAAAPTLASDVKFSIMQ